RPRPFLLECKTFRIRGHEEASGTKYYPSGLIEEWSKKDPVENYELFLKEEGLITDEEVESLKKTYKEEILSALKSAGEEENVEINTEKELADLYTPYKQEVVEPATASMSEKRLVDAVSDGLRQAMEKH